MEEEQQPPVPSFVADVPLREDELQPNEPDDQPESSSQEVETEPETIVETIPLLGTVPLFCKSCDGVRYTKDLTVCPLCGSSSVVKAAIIHYAMDCEEDQHDQRFPTGKSSVFKTGYFKIPCQDDPLPGTARPRNITADLKSVTCPRCLHAVGAEIDKYGRLLDVQEY